MPAIEQKDIFNKDPIVIQHSLPGTMPASTANYGVFFTAAFGCEVLAFSADWEVASSSGTLQLEKLTGTTAPGSGNGLLSSTISTAGAANTANHGLFLISGTARNLVRGDRLAISDGGTITNLVGLNTTTLIKPTGKGHYAYVLGTSPNI